LTYPSIIISIYTNHDENNCKEAREVPVYYSEKWEWSGSPLVRKFGQGPPFRDIRMRAFGLIPGLGDVEITITTSEIRHILSPVNTRADDVLVKRPVSGGQPARAAHITIPFLIEKKAREQVVDPVPVLVKKITFWFLGFF
jgi:hypothetical protein